MVAAGDDASAGRTRALAGQAARTETTEVTAAPEFTNRAFVLAVPRAGAASLGPSRTDASKPVDEGKASGVNDERPGSINDGDLALSAGPPALLCQLYAARSPTSSALGEDVLVGQGAVEFFGQVVQRLRRGEAVSLNVPLESPEGKVPAQVSLQVTMLDTTGSGGPGRVGAGGGHVGKTLRCAVLVQSASNLPVGAAEDGGKAPAAFVAAKTMREAAARLPSRAATRAVPNSCDPVWNEVVTVEVAEAEVDREKVLLAVVNHDTNKLMAKAAVPLRALLVGRHYSMKLLLGGGEDGPSLNVTVVLPSAPAKELEHLAAHAEVMRVEGAVMGVTGDAGGGSTGPVTALWRVEGDAVAARGAPAGAPLTVYTPTDATSEEEVVAALTKITADAGQDMVPTLQGSSLAGPPLWPSGHRAAVTCPSSTVAQGANPALVLELHNAGGMIGRAVMPMSDLGDGAQATTINDVPLLGRSGEDGAGGEEVGKVTVMARAWAREALVAQREKEAEGGFEAGGGISMDGDGAWMLSAMATDMMDKQSALDDAISRLDQSERRVENLRWRCDEAENARRRLEGDNAELRKLLHEERNADPAAGLSALGLNGVTDPMEAKERLGQLAAKYAQEKRRNAELVHRLKAMHEQTVAAEQLKSRHLELQDAHAELSRHAQKCEREAARVGKCRETIEMQEGIIARLEGLLEQAVVDGRRLAEAEAEASRLQDANDVLKGGADWEELEQLRAEVVSLRASQAELDEESRDLQAERVALTLRAEKAEARAIASNNEMLEVSRRCAREIAGLRSKLAEKDAQLMGGFGSVTNMVLGEMPPGPRLTSMEPPPFAGAGGGGGGGVPRDPLDLRGRVSPSQLEPLPPRGSSRPGSALGAGSRPGSRPGSGGGAAAAGFTAPQPPTAGKPPPSQGGGASRGGRAPVNASMDGEPNEPRAPSRSNSRPASGARATPPPVVPSAAVGA